MLDRKSQFQKDWLEQHWSQFVEGELEDSSGRLVTLADALKELTMDESKTLENAFSFGPVYTHDAIEVIAKSYLIDVLANPAWCQHLAEEEEAEDRFKCEMEELAFENYDMKRSAP